MFISGLIVALLSITGVQAEEAPALSATSTDPTRHTAGGLDFAGRLLLQLEADAELISLTLENTAFFLIARPAVAPVPVGNLLIVPDIDADVGWADQSLSISRYLAEHKWNTLTLQPPSPPDTALPERTLPSLRAIRAGSSAAAQSSASDDQPQVDAGDESAAGDEGSSPMPFAEQMRQRLSLALTELQARSHDDTETNALLAIGRSASWAAALAMELGEEWDLILINPRPDDNAESSLQTLLPRIEGRIIDLYYLPLPGYPEAAPDARLRRQLATRNEMTDYHQSRLPGFFRGWQPEMPQLARQLRGIMERVLLTEPEEEAAEPESIPETEAPPGLRNPRPARGPGAV
jgi:hypothetical protein